MVDIFSMFRHYQSIRIIAEYGNVAFEAIQETGTKEH